MVEYGSPSGRMGPPKTILAPPPPPAPPPPSTRSVKDVSPRTPLPGGPGFSSLGPPLASTRTPPGMSAPIVPQHRNEVLHKMLRGLEDDSLTVGDVLGVLETELRSGAPSGPPLTEKFDHYTSPLGDSPRRGPPEKGLGAKIRSPEPMPSDMPLMGPNPMALGVGGGSTPRRKVGGGIGYQSGEDNTQHVVMNCARCVVLEQQIKALAQSLSGLGARMFNWSLAHCRDNAERNGMWHLIVKYLEPVMTVDAKLAETCSGLQAAIGTAGSSHMPVDLSMNTAIPNGVNSRTPHKNSAQKRVPSAPALGSPPQNGTVWQPPGLSASAASFKDGSPNLRTARFAENPMHRAAAPMSPSSPTSSSNRRLPPSVVQQRAHAMNPTPAQTRSHSSPSSPRHKPLEDVEPIVAEISVRFGASKLAKKLNGVYTVVPSFKVNKRPVYALANRYIVHLSDGTWAIKDGPDDDLDADVYAYVKDNASQPHKVSRPWYVAADGDGFVPDSRGALTPGRSETLEMVNAAKSKKNEHLQTSPDAGMKAVAALNARQPDRPQEHHQVSPRQEVLDPPVASQQVAPPSESKPLIQSEKKAGAQVPYEDTSGPARIQIKIISAQGLRKADAAGNSDPFVICEIPGKGMICKTKVHSNTQKPVWNHEHITQYTPGHTLKFTVWDSDTLSSDLLGEAEVLTHRFYPYGFSGELALKDNAKKDTQATLAVKIEALDLAEEDRAHVQDWEDDYDYDNEDWYEDGQQHEYKTDTQDEDPEVAKLRAAFNQFDADHSGKITLAELCVAMSTLGLRETEAELRILMGKVDRGDDGVDFMEFIILMDKLQQEDGEDEQRAKFRALFQSFDVDDSGFISKEELKVVLQAVDKEKDMSEEDIDKVLDEMDSSGDGYIDFTEYVKMMEKVAHNGKDRHVVGVDLTTHARAAALNQKLAPSDKKRIKAFLKRKQFPSEDVNSLKNTGGAFSKKGYEYPLHTAARENLHDMVWLLLESDADPLVTNSAGETPYQVALRKDSGRNTHRKVLEHLRECGGGDEDF